MSRPEILVVPFRAEAAEACLRAAADAAAALPSARLTVLHVRTDPAATILQTEEVMTREREAALLRRQKDAAAAVHAAWLGWQPNGPPSAWVEATGVPAECVVARAHDVALVVLPVPGQHAPQLERDAFDAVLFDCGHPVLAVPPGWVGHFGRHLAIGWRDTAGARRAIAAAEPWLAAASQVSAVEIAGQPAAEPPAPSSGWPGSFTRTTVAAAGRSDGEALLDAVAATDADGLVLGAYRRGRLLEWVMGGVTEHVLREATLPLLLKH